MKLYLQDDESSDDQFIAVLSDNNAVFNNIIKTIGVTDYYFYHKEFANVPLFNIYLISKYIIVENNIIDVLTISGFTVIKVRCEDDNCYNFGMRVTQEYCDENIHSVG